MKVHKLLSCYSYFCKQNVFDGAIKLECLRTTGPLFRTYEPSDYRTFITESCKSRCRTYEPSDYRTSGLESSHRWLHPISPKVRKFEGSRIRRFFSPKVRNLEKKGSGVRTKRFCSPKVQNSEIMKYAIFFSNKYSFVT